MQRRDVRKKKHPELQPYVPSDRFAYIKPNKVVRVPNKEQTRKKPIDSLTQLSKTNKADNTITKSAKALTKRSGPLPIAAKENTSTDGQNTTTIQPRRSSCTRSISDGSYGKQFSVDSESSPISMKELSELSINELHYQSAASDIIQQQLDSQQNDVEPRAQDSVISANENTATTSTLYDKTRNLESLCNELEADLIAEGLMKVDDRKGNLTSSVREDD